MYVKCLPWFCLAVGSAGRVKALLLHPECFLASPSEELLPLHSSAPGQMRAGQSEISWKWVVHRPLGGLALVVGWFGEE